MGWLADTYGFTAGFSFLPLGDDIAIEASLLDISAPRSVRRGLGLDPVEQPVIVAEMRFSHVS